MERSQGPLFQNPTISSGGGCGEGSRKRKGVFRFVACRLDFSLDPILPAPSPLTRIPVVSPPPSERLIAQEEEDNAQTTKGGGTLDERFEAGAGRCGNGWTREVSSASRHACSFRRPLSETHLPRPLARDEEDGTNVGRFDGGGGNIGTGVGDR